MLDYWLVLDRLMQIKLHYRILFQDEKPVDIDRLYQALLGSLELLANEIVPCFSGHLRSLQQL